MLPNWPMPKESIEASCKLRKERDWNQSVQITEKNFLGFDLFNLCCRHPTGDAIGADGFHFSKFWHADSHCMKLLPICSRSFQNNYYTTLQPLCRFGSIGIRKGGGHSAFLHRRKSGRLHVGRMAASHSLKWAVWRGCWSGARLRQETRNRSPKPWVWSRPQR